LKSVKKAAGIVAGSACTTRPHYCRCVNSCIVFAGGWWAIGSEAPWFALHSYTDGVSPCPPRNEIWPSKALVSLSFLYILQTDLLSFFGSTFFFFFLGSWW